MTKQHLTLNVDACGAISAVVIVAWYVADLI